ncbi:MAG: aldo/keto reductase family protein [Planctomycetota bacterium]|nr:aldo/keto reductase family protein [Planctomycetota bacterium]
MQYSNLGHSGLMVSNVSLGSWLTIGNAMEQPAADSLVGCAIDLGINLLDTADVYNRGEAEKALARSIQGRRREHLVIASKCYFPMSEDVNDRGLSRKHIFESIEQSLGRLDTDYLDLYQCHRPDPLTPLSETVMAMDDLIRQGKTLYWGVSMWSADQIAEVVQFARAHALHPPISNQPKYNLYDRQIEAQVIPACQRLGVGQIVFSPLAQGVLTGKYAVGEDPAEGSRAANPKVNQFLGPYLTSRHLEQAEELLGLAGDFGLSACVVALAWCLRQDNVNSVIIGASQESQLTENATAADVILPDELLTELERLFPDPLAEQG